MAFHKSKALNKYWATHPETLEMILKLLGWRMESSGIECTYYKGDFAYLFCDDGDVMFWQPDFQDDI